MTIGECLRWAQGLLPADSANLESYMLLEQVSGFARATLYAWPERVLEPQVVTHFQTLVQARNSGTPIAYLLGRREFYGLELQVDQRVLIPRPETELLVEVVLEHAPRAPARVLDLGTGSGAIALALASQRPDWSVVAVDQSADALALASVNQARLNINNVQFQLSDWFAALGSERYDVIVSNPPYVEPDSPYLQEGDVRFEPLSALVANNHGLADLFAIIEVAHQHLHPGGFLWLEHGHEQALSLCKRFAACGYQTVQTRCDLQGHERVTGAQWP
jgi:release factor glutamine methyltransferase